ncbi:unnamed protein product [Cochlearia groenlandica]
MVKIDSSSHGINSDFGESKWERVAAPNRRFTIESNFWKKNTTLFSHVKTPCSLRSLGTVWGQHFSEEVMSRFYKNKTKSKKKTFTGYTKLYEREDAKESIQMKLERLFISSV